MKLDKKIQHKIESEYFEYKGQRYHAGAKFTMQKRKGYNRWKIVEGSFVGYVNNNSHVLPSSAREAAEKIGGLVFAV